MLDLIIIFITSAFIVISLTLIMNIFMFPRLNDNQQSITSDDKPFVSIMIPARNEAHIIGNTISNLLAQDYTNYEIILLDDNSIDGTSEIAFERSKNDPRLTIMNGQPLPDGWMGKNWACHQMAQIAKGDILIFSDADVQWQPTALSTVVNQMEASQADLFTVWSTQHTHTLAERLTVPLMAMVILSYLPIIGVHHAPFSMFAAANGQCMAWKRKSYQKIGGHEAVKDNVLEDVTLARMVKSQKLRLRMIDGNRLVNCRMYDDWQSVKNGYAKNILAGYGNSVTLLILVTIFHWLLFIFPWVCLILGWISPLPALSLIATGILIRAISASFTHQRLFDAILIPISVLLMTIIAIQSIWWQIRYGGPKWKGRVIKRESKSITPAIHHSKEIQHG